MSASFPQVCVYGTVSEGAVPALLSACRTRCAAPESTLHIWERAFHSQLHSVRVRECQLHCVLADDTETAAAPGIMRTRGIDALNIMQLCRQRATPPCVQARRVTAVPVGANAPQLLHALGFMQSHELLRKGYVFRHNKATVSIFQVCQRVDGSVAWEPLSAAFLVEVLVDGGEDLKALVAEADDWVDALQQLVSVEEVELPAARAAGLAASIAPRMAASGQQVLRYT
jgi:hypothetical protein